MPRGQADGDVVVDVLLDYESAKKYWESFSSYMNMSTKQLEKNLSESAKRINEFEGAYDEISKKLKSLRQEKLSLEFDNEKYDEAVGKIVQLEEKIKQVSQQKQRLAFTSGYSGTPEEKEKLQLLNEQLAQLKKQRQETIGQKNELENSKTRYIELNKEIKNAKNQRKEAYNVLKAESTEFAKMNGQYVQMKRNNDDVKEKASQIVNHTRNIKNNTHKINNNLKSGISHLGQGIKKIIRMSLALIGVRSIYTGISNALRTWMSSEDELAKQTKANLDNLKMNIATILQPALQWVINAFNNILGLIGAVVKQFTKLNIFANKTANSTNKMSKSASDTLASFDKIDVLKQDTGDSGEGQVEPIDMTSFVNKYEKLAEEIKEIFATIFDPIKKAWENKGQDVIKAVKESFNSLKGLGESVGSSIFEVWTNGTGQKTIEHLLGIFEKIVKVIGNVAEAWRKAWENNDTGTKIVQNLWDALNDVLAILETLAGVWDRVTQSEGYQKFIDVLAKGIKVTSDIIKFITEAWREMFEEHGDEWATNFEKIFRNIAEILEPVINFIEQLVQNEEFRNFFKGYVDVLGDGVTFLTDWVTLLTDLLALIVSPDWKHLDNLKNDIKDIYERNENKRQETNANPSKQNAKKAVKGVADVISSATGAVGMPIKAINLVDTIFGNKEKIAEDTKRLFEGLKKRVEIELKLLTGEIKTKWEFITKFLPEKIKKAKEEIERTVGLIATNMSKTWERIKTNTQNIWEGIKYFISIKWDDIKRKVTETVANIANTVAEKFSNIKETVTQKIEDVKTAMSKKWEEIKENVGEKVEGIKTTVGEKFSTMKETVKEKIEDVKKGIWEKWDEIKENIGEKVQKAVDKIKEPFENIGTGIAFALDTAWWNIKNALNTIIEGVETMINRVSSQLNKFTKNTIGATLSTGALGGILQLFGIKTSGGGTNFQPIHIPRLAKGGITTQATPAIIGEAGKEAVLPLEQNTEWMESLADKISEGLNVGINFTGSLSQLAQILKPEIDRENRRVGDSLIKGGVM